MAHGTVAVIRMPRLASVTRHGPPLSCVLVLALSAHPHGLRAQTSSTSAAATTSCLMSIPADSMVEEVVYVTADSLAESARAIARYNQGMMNVSAVVQAVAEQIRTMLGHRSDTLPAGAPALGWPDLDAPIIVTASRDGHMTFRPQRDTGDTKGSAFLSRAFVGALSAGAGFVWPDSTADSLSFRLNLAAPVVRRSHVAEPLVDPVQVPAFTLAVPWREPARVRRTMPPEYPSRAESKRAGAKLLVRFVVDTLGLAEPGSIRDVSYSSLPHRPGSPADFYTDFAYAVHVALQHWTFFPEIVGGCVTPSLVEQPFNFEAH